MKFITDIQLIFVRNLKRRFSMPMWLFLGLMQPVLYLLLYMPLLKNLGGPAALPLGEVTQIFVPGMLVIMGISNLFAGFGFIPQIREGFITRLLVAPVSRGAILLGFILERVFTFILELFVLIIIALLLGLKISLLGGFLTFILVILIGVSMSSISYVISISTKNEDALASMVNLLYLPIMLLSGIMLPISLAPEWLKTAAHFNPFYYAVEGARALFLGNFTEVVILQGFAIVGVFAIVSVWLASRSLRKMAA